MTKNTAPAPDTCDHSGCRSKKIFWYGLLGGSFCTRHGEMLTAGTIDVISYVISPAAERTNRSHAACTHPRTPAGRAACRKANA